MNTLESCVIANPWGVEEECAKFIIDDTTNQFMLSNIANIGREYTLTLWIKANRAGRLYAANKSVEVTTQWAKHIVTFTAAQASVMFLFQIAGTYYIYHPQLEVGNKSTDWKLAPEDVDLEIENVQSETNKSLESANDRIGNAESLIQKLDNAISFLVTDKNGGSLMTQGEHGWTFCMSETADAMSKLSNELQGLQQEAGDTRNTVDILQEAINDHGSTLEYINVMIYEDEPCIELGEGDSDFKLMITNTRIMFRHGSNTPTYINTNGLVTQNIEVQGEIIQGGYVQMKTSDGGWGLLWKGVGS